jgi:hypothetical protein
MTYQGFVPVGALGERIRKAFVAGVLLACAWSAWLLVRNPAFDGWWDAFNWPQLFLYAPILFFLCSAVWQVICFVAEWFYSKAKRKTENPKPEALQDNQRTLNFWLRDSLRICVLYITTCAVGDIPMAVNYVANVRRWPLHLWWSSAVNSCLLLMIRTASKGRCTVLLRNGASSGRRRENKQSLAVGVLGRFVLSGSQPGCQRSSESVVF